MLLFQAVFHGALGQHYVLVLVTLAADRLVCIRDVADYVRQANKKV